jgi:transposase-like protein
MEEERLRKMAIKQYLQGKSPSSIYREIGRSKKWFFKWLHRYHSGDTTWYQDHPKRPRSHPHQTSTEIRKLIINIRTSLEEHPYAQIGTSAIKWECEKLGITPPSDSTINRVLKQEGLVKKNSLYPQGSRISLFHRGPMVQQYPSGRSHRPPIHQGRRTLLFPQCHGSAQPPSLPALSTEKRRRYGGWWPDSLLEEHGYPRLSPGGQRPVFSGEQPLPPLLRYSNQALPVFGGGSGLYPHRRTVA